jgi:CHASE3 domain sensor protein
MGQNGARFKNAAKAQEYDAFIKAWPRVRRVLVLGGIMIGILLGAIAHVVGRTLGMVE